MRQDGSLQNGKVFTNFTSNAWLIPKIYTELKKLDVKNHSSRSDRPNRPVQIHVREVYCAETKGGSKASRGAEKKESGVG